MNVLLAWFVLFLLGVITAENAVFLIFLKKIKKYEKVN